MTWNGLTMLLITSSLPIMLAMENFKLH